MTSGQAVGMAVLQRQRSDWVRQVRSYARCSPALGAGGVERRGTQTGDEPEVQADTRVSPYRSARCSAGGESSSPRHFQPLLTTRADTRPPGLPTGSSPSHM